jgi:ATP-binding cassette subfamily B protein RaxB
MKKLNSPNLKFWKKKRVPLMLQTEAAECGLVCIGMIAAYWGYKADMRNLRSLFAISLKGSTLKSLISISTRLNFRPRPLRLEISQLKSIKTPAILHWDLNHFVVFKNLSGTVVNINDPAIGERWLTIEEVGKHFTGVALELSPTAEFRVRAAPPAFTIRSLLGKIQGISRGLLVLAGLGIAMQICAMVAPFYIQWVVDQVLISRDKNLLAVLGVGFILVALVQALILAARSWSTTALATDLNFQWYGNTFNHLMRLPLDFFEKRHLGDIVSRFNSIQTIQKNITSQSVDAFVDGLLATGTMIIMAVYSPGLAAISLFAIASYAAVKFSLYSPIKEKTREQIIFTAKQQTHFIESSRGIQSIRLFNRVDERQIGWSNLLADQMNAELQVARLNLVSQVANNLIFNIERILVIWLGANFALNSLFTAGMLLAFLSFKEQFTLRMSALVDKYFEFRMIRLYAERLADIVLTEPEIENRLSASWLDNNCHDIELKDVSFRYSDEEPYVLRNVSLHISAGECVALTGPSGSGKTTLVKILLGLTKPSDGEILIGGHRIDDIGVENFRNMLGTVMQEDLLFSGSIADNISFFDPNSENKKIISAARLAAVDEEIKVMPMGYATLIGDIGIGISGGQKQRLLLARALYRDPKILILDEATSNLDIDNERKVNQAILSLGLTRFIVAHRPETISMAERVIRLENGSIVSDMSLLSKKTDGMSSYS